VDNVVVPNLFKHCAGRTGRAHGIFDVRAGWRTDYGVE
jgi:hypothetical protein